MENSGVWTLGDHTITAAGTVIGTPVVNLDGMSAMLLQLRLAYGSAGTTIKAYCQCSADQGTTWYDIACITFATASKVVLLNFSALTPKLTQVLPTDGTLADDTAVDGIIADRVRLKIISTGVYAGSTVLSGRIVAR